MCLPAYLLAGQRPAAGGRREQDDRDGRRSRDRDRPHARSHARMFPPPAVEGSVDAAGSPSDMFGRVTDVVDLLGDLLRFDTTNPPGNEGACIAHVQRLVEDAGCETRIVSRDDARPNLVARLPGAGEAPPLLLYGHVDVVT